MAGRLTERDRLHIIGWYAIANRDYPEAIRTYSELVAAYPAATEAHHQLAQLLRGESRHQEAVNVIRRALAMDPDNPELYNALSDISSEMAQHAVALDAARRYTELAHSSANSYDSLGLALQFSGEHEKAAEAFSRALTLNPRFGIALQHRAILYWQMGRERDALTELVREGKEASGILDPRRFWASAAWMYWRRGRGPEARAALERSFLDRQGTPWTPAVLLTYPRPSLDREPNGWENRGARYGLRVQYFTLAQDARLRGQHEEMFGYLRQALRHPAMWGSDELLEDALADAKLEHNRLDEAIAEYEGALKKFPGLALARYHLAQAYERKGETATAKAQYREFLEHWKHADRNLPEVVDATRRVSR